MKIKTKVRAGRNCGGPLPKPTPILVWTNASWPSRVASSQVTPGSCFETRAGSVYEVRIPRASYIHSGNTGARMKIKTKVRGGRVCAGFPKDKWHPKQGVGDHRGSPLEANVSVTSEDQELEMKIKTKVRAGPQSEPQIAPPQPRRRQTHLNQHIHPWTQEARYEDQDQSSRRSQLRHDQNLKQHGDRRG